MLQTTDVAGMQQVEAAVGEHDAAAIAFRAAKPQNRLLQCEDGIQKVSVRALPEQIVKPEVVVYHARVLPRGAQGPPGSGSSVSDYATTQKDAESRPLQSVARLNP